MPRLQQRRNDPQADNIDEQGAVLIAGSGRFGQIINRMLVANGVTTTVLDHDVQRIEDMRTVNIKSYFGDATRLDLLETAGIGQAAMLVVAIDDRQRAKRLVEQVREHYPNLPIMARAYDRGDAYELQRQGVRYVVKETYHSALDMAREALVVLGFHPFKAEQCRAAFDRIEEQRQPALYQSWLNTSAEKGISASYRQLFIELGEALKQAMQQDRSDRHSDSERGWTPPPRNYDAKLKQDAENQ